MDHQSEARQLIETIRRERISEADNGNGSFVSIVQQALKLLSTQLYDKSTHFLLELLQNADDNAFKGVTPTFSVTYRPGSLRIDCNEVGFTADNVKALCTIGQSTKAGLHHATRYIGEKGIGFKSVFKIADVVWISSLDYTFKFDKRKELGMITPEWETFPEPTRTGYTSFYLKLSANFNEEELLNDVTGLDPELLLFLRNVRNIELDIRHEDGNAWSERLVRMDDSKDGYRIVSLHGNQFTRKYYVTNHLIHDLPPEEGRNNISQSEILLAFPLELQSQGTPKPPQKVYAFLPVRDYGFKFLLQADFLLTTNRKDIAESSVWNCALRDSVADAFLKAVEQFPNSPLRYLWLQYVPMETVSSFFEDERQTIVQRLQQKSVLESVTGTMTRPSSLSYIPPCFMDGNSIPFTYCNEHAPSYISSKYSSSDTPVLFTLGVQQLSAAEFIEHLRLIIANHPKAFRSKSTEWHSKLCWSLLHLLRNHSLRIQTQDLPIIPLGNGAWASGADKDICFSKITGPEIPDGVRFKTVDLQAAQDTNRRELYEKLGVKELSSSTVCKLILQMHNSGQSGAGGLTSAQLIAQAEYLYKSSWRIPLGSDLWFATKKGQSSLGSGLYIRGFSEPESALARLYDKLETMFPFLHDDYLRIAPHDMDNWINWLETTFSLSKLPRLAMPTPLGLPKDFILSDEFRFLFKVCRLSDILLLLRDNWPRYSHWLREEEDEDQSPSAGSQVTNDLKSMVVSCRVGYRPLSQTVLPALDGTIEPHTDLPTVDIEDPHSPRWSMLEAFGVIVKRDIRYYVACLEGLHSRRPGQRNLVYIYEQIQSFCNINERLISNLFREKQLIYLPAKLRSPNTCWFRLDEVQDKRTKIEQTYPSCVNLFRCLMIESGELSQLVAKVALINKCMPLPEILLILNDLSGMLQVPSTREQDKYIRDLSRRRIFPVTTKANSQYDALMTATDDWFIGDRKHLTDSFRGRLPLLAVKAEKLSSLDTLLRSFGVDSRALSRHVRINTIPLGFLSLHKDYTRFLRARAGFFESLVPKSHEHHCSIAQQLYGIEAVVAFQIVRKYTLEVGKRVVAGTHGNGQAAFSTINGRLQVFVTADCVAAKNPHFELIELLAKHLDVRDPTHWSLLSMALNEGDLVRLKDTFAAQGLHVRLTQTLAPSSLRPEKRDKRYAANTGEPYETPSPFIELHNPVASLTHANDIERMDQVRLLTIGVLGKSGKYQGWAWELGQADARQALPFKTRLRQNLLLDPTESKLLTANRTHNLKYLGELMLHKFFERRLASDYTPDVNWTSPLRIRNGYTPCEDADAEASAFTFSRHANFQTSPLPMLKLLQSLAPGDNTISKAMVGHVFYHFDIAASPSLTQKSFPLDLEQFERMRKYRLKSGTEGASHVLILALLHNIYAEARLCIHIDPFRLYTTDRFVLEGKFSDLAAHVPKPVASATAPRTPLFLTTTLCGATSMQQKYKDLAKNEIRLLILLPADDDSKPLRGVIFHTALQNAGSYRALSYVWGTETAKMILNCQDGSLCITSTLHTALQHIREETEPVVLWADAVCIDQENHAEKSGQIRLLPHIFHKATSVIAFLGEDNESNAAIETLMQIRANGCRSKTSEGNHGSTDLEPGALDSTDAWPKSIPPIPNWWTGKTTPPFDHSIWAKIRTFFSRPWFRRAWIIQEVVLASRVQLFIGKWVIDWNDLHSSVETIDHELAVSPGYTGSVESAPWAYFRELAKHREWEARKTRWALLGLLESFRYVQSTLQRDRLFALLGFSSDGTNPAFEPDYEAPLEIIVRRFAYAFIEQGKIMLLLYRAGLGSQPNRFPSWIPDWTVKKPSCLYEMSNRGVKCATSFRTQPRVKCTPSSDELQIFGLQLDTVKQLSKTSSNTDSLEAYLSEVARMITFVKRSLYSTEGLAELNWRVPIADACYPRIMTGSEADMHLSYQALLQLFAAQKEQNKESKEIEQTPESRRGKLSFFSSSKTKSTPKNPTPPDAASSPMDELHSKSLAYSQALSDDLAGWKFMVTERRYVGIVPPTAQVGDDILIFDGGAVPFLVRKSESRPGLGRLVGECYVHGLMSGEARGLEGLKEGWFTLH
jgi:hypothetical protein